MLCLFLPKGTAEPPHEMLNEIAGGAFSRDKKTRTKETGNCLFLLAWGPGQSPILATAVAKAFRRNRQTDLTFTIVKSSKLYFVIFCYILMPFIRNEVTENKLIKKRARLNKLQSEKL